MKDFYKELDKNLKSFENYSPWHEHDIDWCCSRIDWCWKWHKITEEQKDELVNRIITIMEERMN